MKARTLLLPILLIGLGFNLTNNNVVINASEETSLEYFFNVESVKENFSPYLALADNSPSGTLIEYEDALTYKTDHFETVMQNPSSTGSTTNIIYLALKDYVFTNFEATLKGGYTPTSSWGWLGLAFRQETLGAGHLISGAFAGADLNANTLIWGNPSQGGGPSQGTVNQTYALESSLDNLTINLKVVNNTIDLKIYNHLDHLISEKTVSGANVSKVEGYLSIASVDNAHKISYLKVTALDDDGNPTSLKKVEKEEVSKIQISNKYETLKVGDCKSLNYVLSENDSDKNYTLTSSDNAVVVAKGHTIYAIGEGEATIKIKNNSDLSNNDSFKVTVSGNTSETGRIVYDFDSLDDLDEFDVAYVSDAITSGGVVSKDAYFTYDSTLDAIVRTNDQSTSPADDIATVFLKNYYSNFEITLVYKNTNQNQEWAGFFAGSNDKSKRFMDSGYGVFVQYTGYPTIWGQYTGINESRDILYDYNAWHVMRVKSFNGKITMYIDDMENEAYTKTFLPAELGSGNLGFFATGAGYAFKRMEIGYLDDDGNLSYYYPVTNFKVKDIKSTFNVGESVALEYEFNELATNKDVELVSSDSNVCIANANHLYFIGSGEVTITFTVKDDPSFVETKTIIVNPIGEQGGDIAEVPEGYGERRKTSSDEKEEPSDKKEEEIETKKGCNSSASSSVAIFMLLALAMNLKKEKKYEK